MAKTNRLRKLGSRGVLTLLRQSADKEVAKHATRYFKNGPGEYGEGDKFLGLRMPQIRSLLQETFARVDQSVALSLLENPYHEVRMYAALYLVKAYGKAKEEAEQQQIFDVYCSNFRHINNWDLVDVTAPKLTGLHLLRNHSRVEAIQVLSGWCKSEHLWTRRIGVLSTFPFIKEDDFSPSLKLSEMLLDDAEAHDLMHKAAGWMLREVGKRDEQTLVSFLDTNAARMPRVMLRYSLEKLSTAQRKQYMEAAKIEASEQQSAAQKRKKRKRN